MTTILNLDQFRSAFRSGGLRSVGIVASGGLFYVTAQPRTGDRITLATTRGRQMRGFRDAGKAIAVLHAIGARKVEVDISDWSPAQESDMARRRPDAGERKRRADEADGYDAWFRAEIERSLREADSPDAVWVSQEDVRQESAVRRFGLAEPGRARRWAI